jgi:hypothetical protein
MPLIYTDKTYEVQSLNELKDRTLYCLTASSRNNDTIHEGSLLKLYDNEPGRGFLGSISITNDIDIDTVKKSYNNVPITKSVLDAIIGSKSITVKSTSGAQGFTGLQGIQSSQGITGIRGPLGLQGRTGETGVMGTTGAQGPAGKSGGNGLQGPIGPQGPQGATGKIGPTGFNGPKGITGLQGFRGNQGPIGGAGVQGPTGVQGLAGVQGPVGDNAEYGAPSWELISRALLLLGIDMVTSTQTVKCKFIKANRVTASKYFVG